MRKQHVELEELDRAFAAPDSTMHLRVYKQKREELLAKRQEPAPPPPPAPKKATGVSIDLLKRVLEGLGKSYGKAIREQVRDPLRAKIDELEAQKNALEARLKLADEQRASLERRASRHAEHLATLETRVKGLERGVK